jgi:regulatory protein
MSSTYSEMKKNSSSEVKQKIYRYCSYQERSHKEVRRKLFEYGLRSFEADELITHLILEGFLNEERFAKAFAGGKFRMKQWGKLKIVRELKGKGVSKNCIAAGLKEIDESDYLKTLNSLLSKKIDKLSSDANVFTIRDKTARFAIQKGYEPDIVWQQLKELLPG